MTPNKLRSIQEEIRPILTLVDDRKQELRTLGDAVQKFEAGAALALLGAPGIDLRRLASDIIRGIPEQTLVVWVDSAAMTRRLTPGTPEEQTAVGGTWDQLLDQNLVTAFEAACRAEGVQPEPLEVEEDAEDIAVARIQRFANVSRLRRRAPVMVIENMHRLPWRVSERFQNTLRKALDNGERKQLLRLVLTSASDFLSGDAIGQDGDDFGTSPLYFRTQRYTIQPYREDLLWELAPLPGGLPDALIKTLVNLTGGSIGLMELLYRMVSLDPALGRSLHEAITREQSFADDAWFWTVLSRLEPLAQPARQLVREGLGALLSSPKGRSPQLLAALTDFMAGKTRDETTTENLLPLELAGLVTTTLSNGWYHYQFSSPLIANLLRAILPEGKNLREQLELFSREYNWEEPSPEQTLLPPQIRQDSGVRDTAGGKNVHVVPPTVGPPELTGQRPLGVRTTLAGTPTAIGITSPQEPAASPGGAAGTPADIDARRGMEIPEVVRILRKDSSPESARLLLQLVREAALATGQARKAGHAGFLNPTQLELRWFTRSMESGGLESGDERALPQPLTAETVIRLQPIWNVQFRPLDHPGVDAVEAVALFLPPESLARWLQGRQSARPYTPQPSDDAYALGQLIGLLLAFEPNPQLVIERLENRLTNARDLAVGPLVRLVKRCLDPIPGRRPGIDEVVEGIDRVLSDPFALYRTVARGIFYLSMISVVVLGLVDFVYDTRVDNQILLYTGIKVAGATGAALFYGLAFVFFGRTEKEQVLKQLIDFLRQRMNRVRWMAFPAFMAIVFSLFFSYRLNNNWGVTISLNANQKLEEIKERVKGSDRCDFVWRPPSAVSNAIVRLELTNRDYIFIVDEVDDNKKMVRQEYLWSASAVASQRLRRWGETLNVYALPNPPPNQSCLPARVTAGSAPAPGSGTLAGTSGPGTTGTGAAGTGSTTGTGAAGTGTLPGMSATGPSAASPSAGGASSGSGTAPGGATSGGAAPP